jgi:hypothetical protein
MNDGLAQRSPHNLVLLADHDELLPRSTPKWQELFQDRFRTTFAKFLFRHRQRAELFAEVVAPGTGHNFENEKEYIPRPARLYLKVCIWRSVRHWVTVVMEKKTTVLLDAIPGGPNGQGPFGLTH